MHGRLLFALLAAAVAAGCGGGSGEQSEGASASASSNVTTTPQPDPALFDYDKSAPLDVTVKSTQKRGGATVVDVSFAAPDGPVRAYLVRPADEPPVAGALFLHWYDPASNTSNRTEFLEEAVALARDGVVSVLPAQRFPWRAAPTGPEADREAVAAQVVALRRALDVLVAEKGLDPQRLAVVGHDYGGMYGVLLANVDRRPRAYVLMAIDRDFANWFVKYFVRTASVADYEQAFAGIEPVDALAQAAPAAVFLQFAEADQYIPAYKTDELLEATSGPKSMELYGGGHELDERAREDREVWLRERLALP